MKKIFFISFIILCFNLGCLCQKAGAYEVYALKYASLDQPTPISTWVMDGPEHDSVNVIFMIWLIKGNGKYILVDAGCSNDLQEAKDFNIAHFMSPDSVLLQMGLKAEDITDIIISHPHWDHIDGVRLFPNAHIWMQAMDYNYFVGAAWQKDGNHGGFAKRDILKMVELNVSGKLTLVDGDDKEIIPGIKVFTGSRHTFNSQYVLVQTGADKIIFASDNIWIYYNLEKLKSAPAYGTFDPKGYVLAMERMKTLASKPQFIIPGHDAQVFSRFPKISERIVRIR